MPSCIVWPCDEAKAMLELLEPLGLPSCSTHWLCDEATRRSMCHNAMCSCIVWTCDEARVMALELFGLPVCSCIVWPCDEGSGMRFLFLPLVLLVRVMVSSMYPCIIWPCDEARASCSIWFCAMAGAGAMRLGWSSCPTTWPCDAADLWRSPILSTQTTAA